MKLPLIAKVPEEFRQDDAHYFVIVDHTEMNSGFTVYYMLSRTEPAGWDLWFNPLGECIAAMEKDWGISESEWEEYRGPVFFPTGQGK